MNMTRTFQKPIKRMVVKLGSSQMVDERFKARTSRLNGLAKQISQLHKKGVEVVLVSSGAIALGMGELGETRRSTDLGALQARAAIGQAVLMRNYIDAFKKLGLKCGQVLLSWDDFEKDARTLNVRHTLDALLQKGIVPIINENDTTSTEEIKFGDNDKLSALVAKLLHAHLLVILSDVDGVLDANKKVYDEVDEITHEIISISSGTANAQVARGGMKTKIDAVQIAREKHIPCIIAGGNVANVLVKIVAGEATGTYFKV
jgi:glutamate 5-kinase